MAFTPDDFATEMGVRAYGADYVKRGPLASVSGNGGWYPLVSEPFAGAWQRNMEITREDQLAFFAVYACITLIANDLGKLRPRLMEMDQDGIWEETESPAYGPVLRKPNHYQNHIQFKEWWAMSKLSRGNTYALKERDARGVVRALYLLDPTKVKPLVAPNGEVFYELQSDDLNQVSDNAQVIVPASEIIHDRMNCLFHPLVGIAPLYACGISAGQGLSIQNQSSTFFANGARPSGVLTAPGAIGDDTARRIKTVWMTEFSGNNAGRVAVLGDGLKYEPMVMSAHDAQVVDQLKLTANIVCSVYHVPPSKIGFSTDNAAASAEVRNRNYYSDCLQSHVEQWELCMDEGLGIGRGVKVDNGRVIGVDLDVDEGLWRMNTKDLIDSMAAGVSGGLMKTDEGRKPLNLPKVKGGDVIWRQQQYFDLAKLSERSVQEAISQAGGSAATAALPSNSDEPASSDKSLAALIELNTMKAIEAARKGAMPNARV